MKDWTERATLLAAGGAQGDHFGQAVALDGETVLVGAPGDDVAANIDQGSAYVFTGSGATWSQQTQLTAADGATGGDGSFGFAAALDGNTALLGAVGSDIPGETEQGSAYIFTRSHEDWTQRARLVAADAAALDKFGSAVALDGSTALVGVPDDDIGANLNQGSAVVFSGSGATWVEQAQLSSSEGEATDEFGVAVAVEGDTAIIGSLRADGNADDSGAAYVFVLDGGMWRFQQKLAADDGLAEDLFGWAVTLTENGDMALVGAVGDDIGGSSSQGAAYVFGRNGEDWSQQQKLVAADGGDGDGDSFGRSIALSSDGATALIGATGGDFGRGAAYVFTADHGVWSQRAKLTATDGAENDHLGWAVALDGELALVAARDDDVGANEDQGSVYAFGGSGDSWGAGQRITASDGEAGDSFGYSLALEGESALIGVPGYDDGATADIGAALFFTRFFNVWSQGARLTPDASAGDERFGTGLALAGNLAVLGANAGGGWPTLFRRQGSSWNELGSFVSAQTPAYGQQLALSWPTLLVGAPWDDPGGNYHQGSAVFYTLQLNGRYLPLFLAPGP
jgi:hypothetical protein